MASRPVFTSIPWIILIVLLMLRIFDILCDPLDIGPNELGIDGKPTSSAKYGWNLILHDIHRSFRKTKIYQASPKGKKERSESKNKSKLRGNYSPKRSSKCVFGIPDPEHHCGPDIIARIFTKEYMDFALNLWKPYAKKRIYHY